MKASHHFLRKQAGAFTLVEMLVSTAIIALIMLVLVSITNQTSQTWQYTTEKIEKFQKARDGFESMTRRLSQATLNTYWDYLGIVPGSNVLLPRSKQIDSDDYKNFIPLSYGRMSELRFLSGPMSGKPTECLVPNPTQGGGDDECYWPTHGIFFQAPLGIVTDTEKTKNDLQLAKESPYGAMDNLLNTWGYFVEVGYDLDRPQFVDGITPKRWRSCLMEFMQPAEKMGVYELTYPDSNTQWHIITSWVSSPMTTITRTSGRAKNGQPPPPNEPVRPARVLAENVIALIILPKLSKEDEEARLKQNASSPPLTPNYIYDSTKKANPGNAEGDSEINPKNQLPPIVQVTMIAIDERSAARWVTKKPQNKKAHVIGPDTSNLFREKSDTFEKPETGDLAVYEKDLVKEGLTYRIFTTNVSIKGAKWSRAQTQ